MNKSTSDDSVIPESDSTEGSENKWKSFADQPEQESTVSEPDTKVDDAQAGDDLEAAAQLNEDKDRLVDSRALDVLQTQIQALELSCANAENKALKAQADMDNLRRRTQREVEQAHKFGNDKLINDLLPVLDSLQHARDGVPQDQVAMREGLELTLSMFQKVLEKSGLEIIAPEASAPFDPEVHEAIAMVEHPEQASSTVLEVVQTGCQLNGRVIRAAKVVVVK